MVLVSFLAVGINSAQTSGEPENAHISHSRDQSLEQEEVFEG